MHWRSSTLETDSVFCSIFRATIFLHTQQRSPKLFAGVCYRVGAGGLFGSHALLFSSARFRSRLISQMCNIPQDSLLNIMVMLGMPNIDKELVYSTIPTHGENTKMSSIIEIAGQLGVTVSSCNDTRALGYNLYTEKGLHVQLYLYIYAIYICVRAHACACECELWSRTAVLSCSVLLHRDGFAASSLILLSGTPPRWIRSVLIRIHVRTCVCACALFVSIAAQPAWCFDTKMDEQRLVICFHTCECARILVSTLVETRLITICMSGTFAQAALLSTL